MLLDNNGGNDGDTIPVWGAVNPVCAVPPIAQSLQRKRGHPTPFNLKGGKTEYRLDKS
jgi:hypothetical protein